MTARDTSEPQHRYRGEFTPTLSSALISDGVHTLSLRPSSHEFSAPVFNPSTVLSAGPEILVSEICASGCDHGITVGSHASDAKQAIRRALRLALSQQNEEALQLVATIEERISHLSLEETGELRESSAAIRAIALCAQDNRVAALSLAVKIASDRNGDPISGIVSAISRLGYWRLGDHDKADALGRRVPANMRRKSQALAAIFHLSIEAAMNFEQLRLPAARRLASDAFALAQDRFGRDSVAASLPATLIAQIFYEEGYLDDAEVQIRRSLAMVSAGGNVEAALRCYITLARIALHRGQLDHATVILQEAEALGERKCWPRLIAASVASRLDLMLAGHHVDEAATLAKRLDRLASGFSSADDFARMEIERYAKIGKCRVMIAQEMPWRSVTILRQLQFEAICRKDLHLSLELSLLMVEAVTAMDQDATEMLSEALRLGASIGLYQIFCDRSARFKHLLVRLSENLPADVSGSSSISSYLASIIDKYKSAPVTASSANSSRRKGSLSEREREILRLISEGRSNKRIAQSLAIAPETVKSHAKHIFIKLAVATRAEAVSRAEGLGLI